MSAKDADNSRPSPDAHRSIAQRFAREFSTAASERLRCAVLARPLGTARQGTGSFRDSLSEPTCCFRLQAEGVEPPAAVLVEISPAVARAAVGLLLGGKAIGRGRGPLTALDRRLLRRLLEIVRASLSAAWEGLGPQLALPPASGAAPGPPDAEATVLHFEAAIEGHKGCLRVCVPGRLVEPERLLGAPAPGGGPLELRVSLEHVRLGAGTLETLEPGDVLLCETPEESAATVRVAGIPRYSAAAGAYDGKRAVTILGKGDPQTPAEEDSQ